MAYAVPSERFTVFLPPHKAIPDDSRVYRALETGEAETAQESWGVNGLLYLGAERENRPLPCSDRPGGRAC